MLPPNARKRDLTRGACLCPHLVLSADCAHIWNSRLRFGSAHCDLELAVEGGVEDEEVQEEEEEEAEEAMGSM